MSSLSLLVVAGHDSSGRAGIDADREATEHFGLALETAVTAWTVQDADGVRALDPRPPSAWLSEALAVVRRTPGARPAALKVGLLPGVEHVRALAELVDEVALPVVVDPVLSASSGETFLDREAIECFVDELLARPVVLTPNLPEAARLAGFAPDYLACGGPELTERRLRVAQCLLERGLAAVLLKGGHGSEDPIRDLAWIQDEPPVWHRRPRIAGGALRGSGCRYASAVACGLARGESVARAAEAAGRFVADRIQKELPGFGVGARPGE